MDGYYVLRSVANILHAAQKAEKELGRERERTETGKRQTTRGNA